MNAVDNSDGIGVAKIEYSLDGGQTWNNYNAPVVINQSGVHDLKYRSTDFLRNQEAEKSISLMIDTEPPTSESFIEAQQGTTPWYVSDAVVRLQGTDNESGSGVAKIEYSYIEQWIMQGILKVQKKFLCRLIKLCPKLL